MGQLLIVCGTVVGGTECHSVLQIADWRSVLLVVDSIDFSEPLSCPAQQRLDRLGRLTADRGDLGDRQVFHVFRPEDFVVTFRQSIERLGDPPASPLVPFLTFVPGGVGKRLHVDRVAAPRTGRRFAEVVSQHVGGDPPQPDTEGGSGGIKLSSTGERRSAMFPEPPRRPGPGGLHTATRHRHTGRRTPRRTKPATRARLHPGPRGGAIGRVRYDLEVPCVFHRSRGEEPVCPKTDFRPAGFTLLLSPVGEIPRKKGKKLGSGSPKLRSFSIMLAGIHETS